MIYLRLFYEFFKVGLFSVGGGLATIPFLRQIAQQTGWFTEADLANMIAVSESTPGPMGLNMASYVGFTSGGPLGTFVAALGLITPPILIILVVARFLKAFRDSKYVDAVFYGLRPASTALIAAAGLSVAMLTLVRTDALPAGQVLDFFNFKTIALAAAVYLCMTRTPLKKLHPVVFISAGAVTGIVFQF